MVLALAVANRQVVGEEGEEIGAVRVLGSVTLDGSGDMLGVADGFLGVEGFLVAVVLAEEVCYGAEGLA